MLKVILMYGIIIHLSIKKFESNIEYLLSLFVIYKEIKRKEIVKQ